ncbi:MAG TPA: hypothetical protein VFD43_04955, partial [Planctomycetota bacterium]|nr:hypothetical protein [Planctomycetota bacterium]
LAALGLLAAGGACTERREPPPAPVEAAPAHPLPSAAPIEPKFAPGEGPRIRGTVMLTPEVAAQAVGHPVVLILRSAQGGGMPIAVLRIEDPSFPLGFDLGAEHAPLQADDTHALLRAENKLFARVSISGVLTGGPEDLESAPVLVRAGGPEVTLTIDHRRGP